MKLWDVNDSNAHERWDLWDKNGNKLPYTKYRKEQLLDSEYHLVVRVWIMNSYGQVLLSQRGGNKRGPYLWECTAGSAVSGEDSITTINREVMEELSIDLSDCVGTMVERKRRDAHHDFYEIWIYEKDVPLTEVKYDGVEVVDAKWVDIDELERMIAQNLLMPTLTQFPQTYRAYIQSKQQ